MKTDDAKLNCFNRRFKNLPSTEQNQVLIWSFNDCLTPKLILECTREVTAISICPFDGNVIIGGCTSGQVQITTIFSSPASNNEINERENFPDAV